MRWDWGVISTVWHFDESRPIYQAWQGTSMAAPHVSAIAALILSADRGLSAEQVRARLQDHATDLGATGRDDRFGHGLVHAGASVRDGVRPSLDTHVLLYEVGSGEVVARQVADPDGSFDFRALDDGSYRVYAGRGRGDGDLGRLGRPWGAAGGSATPDVVTIRESSIHSKDFEVGWPFEVEPNDSEAESAPLPLGGYSYGWIESSLVGDYYELRVPHTTRVVIETGPLYGACRFAGQGDPLVVLYDSDGVRIASHNDEDAFNFRFCARLERRLEPGTYYVEVLGFRNGTYGVSAREAR